MFSPKGLSLRKVGAAGFEPATLWSQTRCASQTALRSERIPFRREKIRLPPLFERDICRNLIVPYLSENGNWRFEVRRPK